MNRTMNEHILEEILHYSETALCDYKMNAYKMEDDKSRISLLKDIISMANTPRTEPAYIIIGIVEDSGHRKIIKTDVEFDENVYLTYLKGNIVPEMPDVSYYTFKYKRHNLGIWEIGCSNYGPFYSKNDYGSKILTDVLYYRRGSTNTSATSRMKSEIENWMNSNHNDNSSRISEMMLYYNTDLYNYVLILGDDCNLNVEDYSTLAKINWAFIIDMQQYSEKNGFYKRFGERLNKSISVKLLTTECKHIPTFCDGATLFWFMAGGEDDPAALNYADNNWIRKYGKSFKCITEQIEKNTGKSFIYVKLFSIDHKRFFTNYVEEKLGDCIEKYISINWSNQFNIEDDSNGSVNISTLQHDYFESIKQVLRRYHNTRLEDFKLPGINGNLIPIEDHSWFDEVLGPVYYDLENISETSNLEFFRGGNLAWDKMNPCIAVRRDKLTKLEEMVNTFLNAANQNNKKIDLDYHAGAGATTMLRMLAWIFHDRYPVIFIKSSIATVVCDRLKKLYKDLGKIKLILIADNVMQGKSFADDLDSKLKVDGVQFILIYSKRHIEESKSVDIFLEEKLSNQEKKGFSRSYSVVLKEVSLEKDEFDKRANQILMLTRHDNICTPFMYALTTFEGDYARLEEYVRYNLGDLNSDQRIIFTFLSVINYYIGSSLSVNFLRKLINEQDVTKVKSINNYLSPGQKRLLYFYGIEVKVIHYCVAKEIIQYLCCGNSFDGRTWKNHLEKILIDIIEKLSVLGENEQVNRILQPLFLQQTETEVEDNSEYKKHFSQPVVDLASDVLRKNIFYKLLEHFPENAYVYSNLARYYYYHEWHFDKALDMINCAIEKKEDYTFFHIKGMIYTKRLKNFILESEDYFSSYDNYVKEIITMMEMAEDAYQQCIKYDMLNDSPYFGRVILYIKVLRAISERLEKENKHLYECLNKEKYIWCSEVVDKAFRSLDDIEAISDYNDYSFDINDHKINLYAILGSENKILEQWDNVLSNNAIYRPPIRRNIVKYYLKKCNNDYKQLSERHKERIKCLLLDNIKEELNEERNIIMWYEFSRNYDVSLEEIVGNFGKITQTEQLKYCFYTMVVFFAYGLKNKNNSYIRKGENYANKCENLARHIPYRSKMREIYNPKHHNSKCLQRRNDQSMEEMFRKCEHIEGRIESIEGDEKGYIKLSGTDVRIKFNPSYKGSNMIMKNRDENKKVKLVLGFSYSGPYAYDVDFV